MGYISILSSPLQRHHVTYSRFSHAFMFYLVYRICTVAVPLIVIFATPVSLPVSPVFERANLRYTGNYFVSANGYEASSAYPISGIEFSVTSIDADQDGITETFIVTFNSNRFVTAQSIYFALEFIDSDKILHPMAGKLSDAIGGNRANAWFEVANLTREETPQALSIPAALSKAGPMGLLKVVPIASTLKQSKFVSFWQTLQGSTTFSGTISIDNVVQASFESPSLGETFRANLEYFVVLYLLNYAVLTSFYSLLVRSGALHTPVVDENCCSRK